MTEVELELQALRREVDRLNIENAKLKANNGSLESLHMLDQSEILWLRRMVEAAVEGREIPRG